jgi:hypothetical protein
MKRLICPRKFSRIASEFCHSADDRASSASFACLTSSTRQGCQKTKRNPGALYPAVEQVMSQAMRRVFQGEKVPASEKIVSLFEPNTDINRRNKSCMRNTRSETNYCLGN